MSKKYMLIIIYPKYQKSSKTFPLRYLPALSRFTKARQRLGSVSVQTSCTPATHFYAGVDFRIRESARLLRVMCSHAWYRESYGERQSLFFCFARARTHLPRSTPCDSVAYAEGVQKRKAFLFLSFSYFSDRRKVLCVSCTFA